jgi:hypothetical protein
MLKIIEGNYDSVKVTSNNLDWDFKSISVNTNKKVIRTIEKSENKYLVVFDSLKNKFEIIIIFDFKQNESFRMPFLNEKSTFENVEDAVNFIKNDSIHRYGIINYSSKEINRIRLLPSLKIMSEQEYKNLNEQLQKDIDNYLENFQTMDLNSMFFYFYIPNKIRERIINLGYNGLVSDQDLGFLERNFKDVPKLEMFKKDSK